ncbi:hypothetical protein T05_11604 [Trichinella murrelli]|uniref:Uncharacterized protein n=1 Tax=Trichinella murrelli TaxID=144512 RepID=A0A0V0TEY7_9BILA|nr:hypothetical protein T05_11604 [Trichinella murrelli]
MLTMGTDVAHLQVFMAILKVGFNRRPQQARYVHYYFSEKAMPCDGVEVNDLQSLMFFEILDLIASGCFTNAPNYRDLKHDPSIAIQFRYSNVIHCEKIEVADLQCILTFLEDMDLLSDTIRRLLCCRGKWKMLTMGTDVAHLQVFMASLKVGFNRRPQQARYVHYYFSEKAMPCDGVKVNDLQSLMFFEILDLIGELAYSDETTQLLIS